MTQSSWIGQTLNDRYVIQELLGQGGMLAVYKANDPNLRRVVAVKIIFTPISQEMRSSCDDLRKRRPLSPSCATRT